MTDDVYDRRSSKLKYTSYFLPLCNSLIIHGLHQQYSTDREYSATVGIQLGLCNHVSVRPMNDVIAYELFNLELITRNILS